MPEGRRLALIVASSEYSDPTLKRLITPGLDAASFAHAVEDPHIGNFKVRTLINRAASEIRREIEALFVDSRRDDLVLLYFSGHGVKDDDGRLYLATIDTRRGYFRSTAIPASFINETMTASRSRKQILILDCCHSGAFARGLVAKGGESVDIRERFEGRGRIVLTASNAIQYAFEGEEVIGQPQQSVFTRYLVHGLETGEADLDGDGRITIDELYNYVYEHVIDETPKQTPGKWAFDLHGDMYFASSPRGAQEKDLSEALLTVSYADGLVAMTSGQWKSALAIFEKLEAAHPGYRDVADKIDYLSPIVFALEEMDKVKALPQSSIITTSTVDFVLVTALPEELDAVLEKLPGYFQLPPAKDDIRTYYQVYLPIIFPDGSTGKYRIIVMSLQGMGRLQAVEATADAIRRWRPRYILLIGIAGGIADRNIKIGDILISDQIVDYELQKLTPKGPEIRWDVQRADARLLNACNHFRGDRWQSLIKIKRPSPGKPDRHTGPIASGDKVIAFSDVLDKYQDVWTRLIGVEMEAAGVATEAFQSPTRPGFFMVHGVSDLADENKDSVDVDDWREYACDAAASFAIALLRSGPVPINRDAYVNNKQVELILEGEFDEFTSNRQREIVASLAAILNIDPNDIRILKVNQGSIVMILEIPDNAANQLYKIATERDLRILELGIKSIFVEDREPIDLTNNEILKSKKKPTLFQRDITKPIWRIVISVLILGGIIGAGILFRSIQSGPGSTPTIAYLPTNTATNDFSSKPTITARSTPVPKQTLSPTLSIPVHEGTPIPQNQPVITYSNANQIVELARSGNGTTDQIVLSPNGKVLAVAHSLGVHLYDAESFQPLRSIEIGIRAVSVAFSPDGKYFAAGLTDATVRIWDTQKVEPVRTLEGHADMVRSVTFSPNGELLASGGRDGALRIWRTSDGGLVKELEGHTKRINSLAFSPDSKILASCSDDNTTKLWQVMDGALQMTLKAHSAPVMELAFSPDGQILATASSDTTVRLWQVSSGKIFHTLKHSGGVESVAFSPDGSTLATGSRDTNLRIWRISNGTLLKTLEGHRAMVSSLVFYPDGQTIVSLSDDGTIRQWRVTDGKLVRAVEKYTGLIRSIAISPDGNLLAYGTRNGTIHLWDIKTGKIIRKLEGHTDSVTSLSFVPGNNDLIVSGSDDKTVRMWQISSGITLRTFKGNKSYIESVAISPDGKLVSTGAFDGTVHIWEISDEKLIKTFPYHTGPVWGVAFSPNGNILASSSLDGSIMLWNVSDWTLINKIFDKDKMRIWSIAFSPDSKTLLSSEGNGTGLLSLWEVSSGDLLWQVDDTTEAWSINFSPNGQILASGSLDNTIHLRRASDGELLKILSGHTHQLSSVAFIPDGKLIASGSWDGTSRIWGVLP